MGLLSCFAAEEGHRAAENVPGHITKTRDQTCTASSLSTLPAIVFIRVDGTGRAAENTHSVSLLEGRLVYSIQHFSNLAQSTLGCGLTEFVRSVSQPVAGSGDDLLDLLELAALSIEGGRSFKSRECLLSCSGGSLAWTVQSCMWQEGQKPSSPAILLQHRFAVAPAAHIHALSPAALPTPSSGGRHLPPPTMEGRQSSRTESSAVAPSEGLMDHIPDMVTLCTTEGDVLYQV